ncbi:hypothetical protein JTB14_012219 [Gonioctena quinquepunctata]|nr:hypothetical protein JTB14_012219 [Gonioctena quinquepunctata]
MKFLVLLPLLALAAGAPQYQPLRFNDVSGQYKQEVLSNNNDGQYHPDNSGTYIHSDDPYKYQGGSSSIYNGGIGAYTPTKSFDGQYKSDNAGAYNNDDGQYHPDNSGAYNSDNSGQYKHSDDPYKHQGDSSGTGTLGFSRPYYNQQHQTS